VSQPEPPQQQQGMLLSFINAVKGMSLFNVLIVALMLMIALPTYVVYRIINDEELLDRFLSSYKIYDRQVSSCTLRKARQRGEPYTWAISSGFAFEGGTRWSIGVALNWEPDDEQVKSYCETLEKLVDHMRQPQQGSPVFPGTDKPVVQPYRP
jgi:hypothetical protein